MFIFLGLNFVYGVVLKISINALLDKKVQIKFFHRLSTMRIHTKVKYFHKWGASVFVFCIVLLLRLG